MAVAPDVLTAALDRRRDQVPGLVPGGWGPAAAGDHRLVTEVRAQRLLGAVPGMVAYPP